MTRYYTYHNQESFEETEKTASQDSKPQISRGDPKLLLTALQETFVTLFQGDLVTPPQVCNLDLVANRIHASIGYMGVSKNRGTPKSSIFIGCFQYKPGITR